MSYQKYEIFLQLHYFMNLSEIAKNTHKILAPRCHLPMIIIILRSLLARERRTDVNERT